MTLTTCPRCSEPVRVPSSELPTDAQAKCPWCHETFSAAEVQSQLPPEVEFFDATGQPLKLVSAAVGVAGGSQALGGLSASQATHEFANSQESEGWQHDTIDTPAPVATDSEAGESEFETVLSETWTEDNERNAQTESFGAVEVEADESGEMDYEPVLDDAAAAVDVAEVEDRDSGSLNDFQINAPEDTGRPVVGSTIDGNFSSMPLSSLRKKKSKRSALRTLIGIALGPILALPIAGFIFYLLGTDLGFWPLDGGRDSGGQMKAAPPLDTGESRFPIPDLVADSGFGDPASASDMRPLLPPADDSRAVASGDGSLANRIGSSDTRSRDWTERGSQGESIAGSNGVIDPLESESGNRDATGYDLPDTATGPETGTLAATLPDKNPVLELPAGQNPSEDRATRNLNKPKRKERSTEIVESTDLVLAVEDARTQLGELKETSRTSPKWKSTLAATYAKVAKLGEFVGGDQSPSSIRLLSDLKQSEYLDDLAAASPLWLRYDKRPTNGVLLIGRPGSSESGPTIELDSGTPVVVESKSGSLPPNKRVIAIGLIKKTGTSTMVELTAVETIE